MITVLFAWIGLTDLRASTGDSTAEGGPIAEAMRTGRFERLVLLCDRPKNEGDSYVRWLAKETGARVSLRLAPLGSPANYEHIYRRVRENLAWARKEYGLEAKFLFHLSPGTPQMAVVWILASSKERADLVQSAKGRGLEAAQVPFQIAAEFVGDIADRTGSDLRQLSGGLRPPDPSFKDLLHQSKAMGTVIERARVAALVHAAPILIEGESGTGKELLAAAIHRASGRKGEFIAVNCGAIPKDLVEAEFFGAKKGAFTGATSDRDGHFVKANGGTLFLDEIGELPPPAQVKLLRALQEGVVVRVGESRPIKVDVRIVSATNRDLAEDAATKSFREDLYYRLAVLSLRLPPLRDREGDILLLAEHILAKQQEKLVKGGSARKLSPAAKRVLLQHHWPGNVRELEATLLRALVWSVGDSISDKEVLDAMAKRPAAGAAAEAHIEDGFDLRAMLRGVSSSYVRRALELADNNKSAAAKLIGFGSPQLLTQWMKRLGIDPVT